MTESSVPAVTAGIITHLAPETQAWINRWVTPLEPDAPDTPEESPAPAENNALPVHLL